MPTCMWTHRHKCIYIACTYSSKEKKNRVLHNMERMLLQDTKMIVCLFFYSSPIDQKKGPFPNAGTSAINLIPQLDIRWLSCTIPNWMVVFGCKSCVLSKDVNSVTFFFKSHSYLLILYWGVACLCRMGGQRATCSSQFSAGWLGIRLGSKCLSPKALGQNSPHGASSEHFSPAKTSLQPTVTFLASCFVWYSWYVRLG